MSRKKEKRTPDVNLLELVPERTVGSGTGEDGIVTVHAPRFHNRLLKRLIEPRLRRPQMMIRLDGIGTAVWEQIDGERTVGEIGAILRERFGETIEPCHDRLAVFFTQLELSRFIRWRNLEEVRGRRDRAPRTP
ncbi:MAG: PqqD family protein [Candidatus Krumholzibacteria bacterium]|nr:PqqD family protein [Candidatus Krumholzibacteria bacterium]